MRIPRQWRTSEFMHLDRFIINYYFRRAKCPNIPAVKLRQARHSRRQVKLFNNLFRRRRRRWT